MTLTALTPFCSILVPSSAETGDHETAIESTSTALVPYSVDQPSKIDDDESKPFPFTKLPGEIRNRIYSYVLGRSHPIHSYWFRKPTNPNFAAILQVSRLINSESTVILYRENTIRFMARTLRVPFADAYPSTIIDIPSRFVPWLKRIAISTPKPPFLTNMSATVWRAYMWEFVVVLSQLTTAAPRLESITDLNWYYRGGTWRHWDEQPTHFLYTVINQVIARHRYLKELIVVYGPVEEEYSTSRVVDPQLFPGYGRVQQVVGRTLRSLDALIKARPLTVKIPFAMNGTDPAEVRRRLGLR